MFAIDTLASFDYFVIKPSLFW